MTIQPADLYELAKKIRYDATAIQAKVTDLLNALNELNLPDQPISRCFCGAELRGPRTLAEHVHISHDGPIPDHWAEADLLAVEPPADSAPSEKKGAPE